MGNVAEGLHFLEKWGNFFIFFKILMKFDLKMCTYPLNMMVGYFPDSKVGFGYVFDLKKLDSEALEIVADSVRIVG